MTGLLGAVRDFGLSTVAAAVLIYIVIRDEFVFRYPSRRPPRERR